MTDERSRYGSGESGFALILAILSLLLLTFLGLTLAASTTTELQIATNYRWSEQAFYNAEAGMEVAKAYLRAMDPATFLPPQRPAWIQPADGTRPVPFPQLPVPRSLRNDAWGNGPRNFAPSVNVNDPNVNCDWFGGGAGYGVVFDDGATPGLPLQNVTQIVLPGGQVVADLDADGRPETLRGAFTVWIRRPLEYVGAAGADTTVQEALDDQTVILTSEGVAPAEGAHFNPADAGNRAFYANRASRVLEATVRVGPRTTTICDDTLPQASETGLRCVVE
jgi:PilX N-terminal